MQKPNGYDEARAAGDYIPVEAGGHYCTILQVSETQTTTGRDMIVVLLDFDNRDKQAGYFRKSYDSDDRPKSEKKWPFAGSKWIMVNDYQDNKKTSRQFKTFCSCVEKSNNMTIAWGGSDWGRQFQGKKIGAVYGQEEQEYNGKVSMRTVIRYFCGTDVVETAATPEPKYLDGKKPAARQGGTKPQANDFVSVPDDADEEIPF